MKLCILAFACAAPFTFAHSFDFDTQALPRRDRLLFERGQHLVPEAGSPAKLYARDVNDIRPAAVIKAMLPAATPATDSADVVKAEGQNETTTEDLTDDPPQESTTAEDESSAESSQESSAESSAESLQESSAESSQESSAESSAESKEGSSSSTPKDGASSPSPNGDNSNSQPKNGNKDQTPRTGNDGDSKAETPKMDSGGDNKAETPKTGNSGGNAPKNDNTGGNKGGANKGETPKNNDNGGGNGVGSITVIQSTTIIIIWINGGGGADTTTYNPKMPPPAASNPTGPPPAVKTHDVTVGGKDGPLLYTPDSIIAAVGDMVVFTFLSQNHTLTQSTFDTPCKKLADGMDSGFIPNPNSTISPAPQMAMQVTVDTPIWFYCRQVTHCGKGMVFSINPTAEKTHAMFRDMAMAQNGTPATPPAASPPATSPPPAEAPPAEAPPAAAPPAAAPPAAAPPAVAPPSSGGMQPGSGTGSGGSCSCSCFCGVSSFPSALQGRGNFGGMSGSMQMSAMEIGG